MKEINKRLARLRKFKGFRQREMAALLDLKESTYSQMERQGGINCKMLLRICEVLNCSPLEILYDKIPNDKIAETKPPYEENPLLRVANALIDANPVPTNRPIIPIEELGLITPEEKRMLNFFRRAGKNEKHEILNFAYAKINSSGKL